MHVYIHKLYCRIFRNIKVREFFPRMHVDVRMNGSSFGTQFLIFLLRFCACYFFPCSHICSRTKSLPCVIPPYRCDDTDTACLRRIEKQDTHPHVRLGHGSKDTAHVRVDTSISKDI